MHENPSQYRNLYQYLVFRYPSPLSLNRITVHLFDWEKCFHDNDRKEVIKCWRLHLGSDDVVRKTLSSLEPGTCAKFLSNQYLHYKNQFHRWHAEHTSNAVKIIFRIPKIIYFALGPLLGSSFMYFDICKDIFFAYLIYTSLHELTNGQMLNKEFDFEAALTITLIFVIVLVQVSDFLQNHRI